MLIKPTHKPTTPRAGAPHTLYLLDTLSSKTRQLHAMLSVMQSGQELLDSFDSGIKESYIELAHSLAGELIELCERVEL